MKRLIISTIAIAIWFSTEIQGKETKVLFQTNMGNITVKLYNETPKHRDNMIKLVNEHYYDSLLFHRVLSDFIIQTGDPNSKNAPKDSLIGTGEPEYTIDAEINPKLFHKRGAIGAARTPDNKNPQKASSGSQFYFVQNGRKMTDDILKQMEIRMNGKAKNKFIGDYLNKPENKILKQAIDESKKSRDWYKIDSINAVLLNDIDKIFVPPFKLSRKQRKTYNKIGGTPQLDGEYTVFGEVIEGLDVVDKISNVKTNKRDRPEEDIMIISAKIIQ
jgi:peptidylprolyl isomerase